VTPDKTRSEKRYMAPEQTRVLFLFPLECWSLLDYRRR